MPRAVRFGEFELIPELRRLERNGETIEVSSRAMDILCLLLGRPGQVVSKREILERVWPDVIVDEGSVRFHVAGLRRALGDGENGARFIATVPGRGYCFVGMGRPAADAGVEALANPPSSRLPAAPPFVIGRDEVIADIIQRLEDQRFVTVVGPAGIGKTTAGLMAAHRWAASRDEIVTFVDLGALSEDTLEAVADALAAALGISQPAAGDFDRMLHHLREQSQLIVLDTCERVIEGAARLAEAVLAHAPEVRLLATSRESLRAEGESVYRIEPLAAPKPDAGLSAQDALSYPAVQLFVHRAAANHVGFELRDQDAPVVSAICRDLDGMALAIELAAGRVEAYGVRQVADLLSTEFALTWPGRRTAVPRQQTLNATLNWSHELLGDAERGVFRRMSVFVGAFSLDAALAVAMEGAISPTEAIEALSSLVAKSLLSAETGSAGSRYRMLDTTRAYAGAKLAASTEEPATRRWHAEHYLRQLGGGGDWTPPLFDEQTANLRAAHEWAFGPGGDRAFGVKLAAAATPFWLRHGLLLDCRRWSREAISELDRRSAPSEEIDDRIALVGALTYTDGLAPEIHRGWQAAYDVACRQGRREHQFTGLLVLWGHEIRKGRYQAAQAVLDTADFLGKAEDASQRAMAHWMIGFGAHCRGDQALARERLERLVSEFTEDARRPILRRFGYDLETAALRTLSIIHFLAGDFGAAWTASERSMAKAGALGYALSLSEVRLWRALLLFLFDENAPELETLTASNVDSARLKGMGNALGMALATRGLWLAKSGDLAGGAETAEQGFGISSRVGYPRLQAFFRAEVALQVARQRDRNAGPGPAMELADDVDAESWCTPEILRIKGEVADRDGDPLAAEEFYRQALEIAGRQGALAWRLRAANGLAGLWLAQGRPAEAAALLAPIVERFEAGLQQQDLRLAAQHLEACRKAASAPRSVARLGDAPVSAERPADAAPAEGLRSRSRP